MNQLDIFDAPVARSDDPDTSWSAARSVLDLNDKRRAVLEVISQYSQGITDDELVGVWPHLAYPAQSPSGLRTRRKELCEMDLVMDSGRRAPTATGRSAVVWEAV